MMMRGQQGQSKMDNMKMKLRKTPGSRDGGDWTMAPPPPPPSLPACSMPAVGFPRSAFEAVHDESSKFRQLPCRTHISVGVCPYREKCVFLHDPRCCSVSAKSITRLKNKNKDDCIADSLYWPAMPRSMVMQYPDSNNPNNGRPKNPYQSYDDHHDNEQQPHTVQPYCVPVPQQDQYHLHDAAVYSMWMHFVDFCLANASPSSSADSAMCYAAVDVAVNPYSRSKRLPVFRALCRGSHLSQPVQMAPVMQVEHRELRRDIAPPQRKPLQYSPQSAPLPAPVLPFSAPLAPSQFGRAIAPPASAAVAPPAAAMTSSALAQDTASVLTRTPPSPAVLVRRQSASSPVSIIDANALEFDFTSELDGYIDADDLCDLDAGDCGVGAGALSTAFGGAFSSGLAGLGLPSAAVPAAPAGGVSPLPAFRLQKQNLPQNLVSPMMLQSLF